VTCCGLVGADELTMNVYPFILRGVSLIGIDSVNCPRRPRLLVWQKLADIWKPEQLETLITEVALEEVEGKLQTILQGGIRGRVVVRLP